VLSYVIISIVIWGYAHDATVGRNLSSSPL